MLCFPGLQRALFAVIKHLQEAKQGLRDKVSLVAIICLKIFFALKKLLATLPQVAQVGVLLKRRICGYLLTLWHLVVYKENIQLEGNLTPNYYFLVM